MTRNRTCVFRADASKEIGGGHIMRCLALAHAMETAGWNCAFACQAATPDAVPALARSGHDCLWLDCEPAHEPAMLESRWPEGVDAMIVDHYRRGAEFERACRGWAKRIFVIDDLADRRHDADLLLDQTFGRAPADYASLVPPHCRVLAGADYALLPPRFAELRCAALQRREQGGPVERILVSMGMSDPDNVAGKALQAIAAVGLEAKVDVVMGAAAPHLDQVRRQVQGMDTPTRVHVDIKDMPGMIAAADIAVGAAGTGSWERCCLGLATVVVITADNQRDVALALANAKAAHVLGKHDRVTPASLAGALQALATDGARRAAMAIGGARLCDGLGTARVVNEIDPLLAKDGAPVTLRPATMDDADLMLRWQSNPRTRRFARNPQAPSRREHARWLREKLVDPDCILEIILHGGEPAGTLRLDRCAPGAVYEVSIVVDPARYRLNLASQALALARKMLPEAKFRAEVLACNEASHALFIRAGYERSGKDYVSRPAPKRRLAR